MSAAPPDSAATDALWTSTAKLEEFRAAIAGKIDRAIFDDDEATLKRYLIARKGEVAESAKMILRSQQWRQDDCVPYGYPSRPVPLDSISACLATKAAFVHGVDRENRPIVWVKGKLHDGNLPRDAVQKWIIHLLDELISRGSPSFTGVIDAADMGWSNLDKGALNFLLVMLSANYPEQLGRLYILNEGMIFRLLWKLVEPFLDARTSKKIFFLGGPDSHRAKLAEAISAENLPVDYGGKDAYTFGSGTGSVEGDVRRDCATYNGSSPKASAGGSVVADSAGGGGGAEASAAAGAGAAP